MVVHVLLKFISMVRTSVSIRVGMRVRTRAKVRERISGEASPIIVSCYANIFVFIICENNQFPKKWIVMI